MVEYQEFVSLSQSMDSEDRGAAAHLSALAYLNHHGAADEHAALYASLVGFLDDPSVKVRAALAYGLLHSAEAPRPVMLALLHDSAVIARAVVQYSPVLIDADLIGRVREFDLPMLIALSQRQTISARLAATMIARNEIPITLRLLRRHDIGLGETTLNAIAQELGEQAEARGALLARPDLPASARLLLIQRVTAALREVRLVKGALTPEHLNRVLRNSSDTALSAIGERDAARDGQGAYVATLIERDVLSTRVLMHAVVTGHVMFFANCLAELGQTPSSKVFSLLESGSRSALNALLVRCGISDGVRNLLVRLVLHARATDLADDAAARHYVVTALTEELIAEYRGDIPEDLEQAFAYLSEQNIVLARKAARGVMKAFARDSQQAMSLPAPAPEPRLALPAA
jgi:uncharacterized protein (DUF2336 family)